MKLELKIERPSSIFGKVPLIMEQIRLNRYVDLVSRGLWIVNPEDIEILPIKLPELIRMNMKERAKDLLTKSKTILEEIGA
jgi:hypothetical protein